MPNRGVRRRLLRVFLMQLAAVSVAVALGVFGSGLVLKNVLMERALQDEAALFAARLEADPTAAPPHTYNLRGYLRRGSEPDPAIPEDIAVLAPGTHYLTHHDYRAIVLVDDVLVGRSYLIFAEENVTKLAFVFGIVPLTLLLTGLYLVIWWTHRMSHRAVSPLIGLARKVKSIDLNQLDDHAFEPDVLMDTPDQEVYVLVNALQQLHQRLQRFVERERNFTRDASHELRTPITVIQMAAGMLLEEAQLDDYGRRQAGRIQAASRDMQSLIEALLVLARESGEGLEETNFSLSEVVTEELDKCAFLLRKKNIALEVDEQTKLTIHGSRSVAAVMIGNLIRNACAYTQQGTVKVTIGDHCISVDDSGVGMSKEEVDHVFEPFYRGSRKGRGGHGVGLTIVKRLSDRFNWPVEIESEVGIGTRATIYFRAELGTSD